MENNNMLFYPAFSYKLIYIFRINDSIHNGKLKIGEATVHTDKDKNELTSNCPELVEAAKNRINDYTSTAGIKYELLHTELAVTNNNKSFKDTDVHDVLLRSGYDRFYFDTDRKQNEWFIVNLDVAKNAITAVKEGRQSLTTNEKKKSRDPIVLRPEQEEAVNKTIKQFEKSDNMLWNAKMRFGKTISALELTKRKQFKKTIIITHRPVVDEGWYEDFNLVFFGTDYMYGSKRKGEKLENLLKLNKPFIYFASMQDLRGAETVGGKFKKDEIVFNTNWDFVIIDEAHEGTKTEKGVTTLEGVIKLDNNYTTKILKLSGTAFNLLEDYDENEIYTWDYIMEQDAKRNWNLTHNGDPNPYADLPELNIYTYDLNKLIPGYEAVYDTAFNFKEFFRVWTGDVSKDGKELPDSLCLNQFVHKDHVKRFLDLICKSDDKSNYPYSRESYRDYFRHSLWIVPGVKEARALSKLLQEHSVFGSGQFKIINIAGDGDEEVNFSNALQAVQDGIGPHPEETYTITLSCGKLTTGVTVKPWTAVFMLAGSYSTQASSYLQTIFRVQSPANIGGRIKEKCYVFDFAPDRSLKMIASATKLSKKAGDTSSRTLLGKFLNFCPVISINGSRMIPYNVESMMGQLKKAYAERVATNGFDDKYIYNDNLYKLDETALEKFKDLQEIVGASKQTKKVEKIDINNQGFINEEYEKLKEIEKKPKRELTDEEKKLREELLEKRKQAGTAISILRGISIRIPLLIYGADIPDSEDITIDNLTSIVDDVSWNEFMPKGVTKEMFKDFSKYYEQDIFIEAGRKIRRSARYADTLSPTDRLKEISNIFSTFRNPDKETVLTPWRTVNMHMSDTIGGYSFVDKINSNGEYTIVSLEEPKFISYGEVTQNILNDTHSKILEINSKSGLYPLYITYSLFRQKCLDLDEKKLTEEVLENLWNEVLNDNIFVLCKTPMAKTITERTLRGYKQVNTNIKYNKKLMDDIQGDLNSFSRVVNDPKYWGKEGNYMNFDAVVGNPPYQESVGNDGGNSSKAKAVYNLFLDGAFSLKPRYISMIMPSRWMTKSTEGIQDAWVDKIISCNKFTVMHDYLSSNECFSNVDIKGGVCYYLIDDKYNGKCNYYLHDGDKITERNEYLNKDNIGIVIRDNVANDIIDKIIDIEGEYYSGSKSFSNLVGPKDFFTTHQFLTSSWDGYTIKKDEKHTIMYYYNKKSKGYIGYVDINDIPKNKHAIAKNKVFIPAAGGSGNDKYVLGRPFYGEPGSVCSQTYLVIGYDHDLSKEECNNIVKYIKTKFFRYLVSIKKKTQNGPKMVYQFVPIQNFTNSSDIDWSKSSQEIDKQLYKKYKLNPTEIDYINDKITYIDEMVSVFVEE